MMCRDSSGLECLWTLTNEDPYSSSPWIWKATDNAFLRLKGDPPPLVPFILLHKDSVCADARVSVTIAGMDHKGSLHRYGIVTRYVNPRNFVLISVSPGLGHVTSNVCEDGICDRCPMIELGHVKGPLQLSVEVRDNNMSIDIGGENIHCDISGLPAGMNGVFSDNPYELHHFYDIEMNSI
eukprot:GHVO01047931.1.p1 GENE.GHVO01047931.1~~GHVO01047931.1.p1  ORF type:complete len:181 (+),score=30.07 GHVO01047931.1:36-578(+)